MTSEIQPYSVVALAEDVPSHSLARGQVGTIVEQYGPDDFEVEFSDDTGRTYALLTLSSQQFLVLRYEPLQMA